MWVDGLFIATAVFCGLKAIWARQLLTAALWLAGVSVFVALTMYHLGAADAAVIELSVGAGLVTILFVFAIAMIGEDVMIAPALVPWPLQGLLLMGVVLVLSWLVWPTAQAEMVVAERPFAVVLWQERGLDILVQMGLIFAGVMGILGIMAEEKTTQPTSESETGDQEQPSLAPLKETPA